MYLRCTNVAPLTSNGKKQPGDSEIVTDGRNSKKASGRKLRRRKPEERLPGAFVFLARLAN
jgi:hypothetical protein